MITQKGRVENESFILDQVRKALAEYRAQEDGNDPQVVNFPSAALIDLHRAIAMTAKEHVWQVMTFSSQRWQVDDFEHVIWREASRKGLKVKRLYILPHRGIARDVVDKQIFLDESSGIEPRVLIVGHIPQSDDAVDLDGLWIVDSQAVVLAPREAEDDFRGGTWTVTERQSDLRAAGESWKKMWNWSASDQDASSGSLDLEEPLVLSADLINGVAHVLCTHDQIDSDRCVWYHSAWQYLRLLDMVSTPSWHAGFYSKEISRSLAGNPNPKILITGTADYSMLAYVYKALEPFSPLTQPGVVDQCPTPLFACRWLSNRVGHPISVFEDDVLRFDKVADGITDLVCTDAFLTRFRRAETESVLRTWARLLKSGGRLVTTVRVHPRCKVVRDPEEAVMDFRERAIQRSKRWRSFLRRSPVEIGQMAEVYARRMRSEDIGDEAQICSAFRSAGFEINTKDLVEAPGELYSTVYLELACTKK